LRKKTVKVKIDITDDGEPYFLIPEKLKNELLLEEGDVIEWIDNHDGSWTLIKVGSADENTVQIYSVESVLTKYPFLKTEIEEVFGSIDLGIEWLTSDIPALGGLTPVDVIKKGDLKLVLMTLNKIKYGEFS